VEEAQGEICGVGGSHFHSGQVPSVDQFTQDDVVMTKTRESKSAISIASDRSSGTSGRSHSSKRSAVGGLAGRIGHDRNASDLVRVAFDEFNLATFPISVLDKKAQSSKEPLQFNDTITWNGERVDRMWKVFPHPEKGFPGPIDDDVMMALLELTREQGGSKRVFFSRYDLLKRLGWPINATYYTRLETSFKKLAAVRVEAINAFGDRARKRFVNMGLTFIQEWKLNSETRGGEKSSYILWSDRIADSINQELTRYLDATFYFEELTSAIERRLFRYLDNYFDNKQFSLVLNVRDLSHEHLGVSRQYKYISQVMQRLEPALNTLVEKGYLESWLLSGETLYVYKRPDFGARLQLALPFLAACEPAGPDASSDIRVLERLLVERGVVAPVAARLCSDDSADQRDRIDRAIRYLDGELAAGKRFANPGGFLVSLIGRGAPEAPSRRATVARQGPELPSSNQPAVSVPKAARPSYEIEYAYQSYLNELGLRSYEGTPPEELETLVAAKRRELLASKHEKTFRKMPEQAFDEHVRYVIRKDMAAARAVPFEVWLGKWNQNA